jgi:opacity protein-like surface antigen
MKKLSLFCLCTVFILAMTGAAQAAGDANFFLGQKSLDSDDWEPIDGQMEYGVCMNFGVGDWPVSIAVDILMSSDDTTYSYDYYGYVYDLTLDGETMEIAAGVRKFFNEESTIQPYIGGGATYVDAEVKFIVEGIDSLSASDSGFGFWANAGVMFRLGERFNLGLDLRYSKAEVTVTDPFDKIEFDVEAGGMHYGVLLGFRWGE